MINPNNESFEQVSVFDTPALFTSDRIDREKLPEGAYAYDIRHSDDDGMEAAELKEYIMVNHMGTIITKEPIDLGKEGSIVFENEDDFYFTDGDNLTLEHFINNEIPAKETPIDVVIVEPLRQPYHAKIDNTLMALQQKVGGYIEIINPFLDSNIILICDEEGKIKVLPLNRKINNDIIAGTFVIAGSNDEGDFISLSDEEIEKYKKEFNDIVMFNYSSDIDKPKNNNIDR